MTYTYAQATTAQTELEILADSLQYADDNEVNVAGFDDASPQRALFELDARALAAEQRIRANLARSAFLTTAAIAGEDWFDQALTWYGETRIPATPAVWVFKVSLVAGASAITIGANSRELVAQADDGTLFTSANVVPILIPSGGYNLVQFNCDTLGSIGNKSAGTITSLAVGHPGLSVTNASPGFLAISARDKETTAEATSRALAKWSTIGAGWTRASFDYLIPTIARTVTRWLVRDDNPLGPGTIEVIMANSSGPSSIFENGLVLAGLGAPDVMTLGTGGLVVNSASEKLVTVTGSIVGDGSSASLLADAKRALDTLQSKYPVGGNVDGLLTLDLLNAVLMGGAWPETSPLKITGPTGAVVLIVIPGFSGAKSLSLATPAGDTSFAMTDVLVFDYSGLVVT